MKTKLHKNGRHFTVSDPVQMAAFLAEGWSTQDPAKDEAGGAKEGKADAKGHNHKN
jgi:hypothetical protein